MEIQTLQPSMWSFTKTVNLVRLVEVTTIIKICLEFAFSVKYSTKMGMFCAQSNFSLHCAHVVIFPYIWTNVTVVAMCILPCLWHRLLTLVTIILWVVQHFDYSRSLDSVTNLAVRFCTFSSSSWLNLLVPNLIVLLQDWTHQSFISCSFNDDEFSYLLKHKFIWGRNRNSAR